jgi:sugar lactone lactonase YvrE
MTWRRRRIGTSLAIGLTALAAIVLLLLAGFFAFFRPPVEPFEPVAWDPPPAFPVEPGMVDAETGAGAVPLVNEAVDGPEDLAVDEAGRVYTGDRTGRILRVEPERDTVEVFAHVGGRPLGLAFDADRNLIVANHGVGLQSVSPTGDVTLLTSAANGKPIRFANDLAIARDGMIYLSDSNAIYNRSRLGEQPSFSAYDFLDGRPLGRLLRYDPVTRATTELRSRLYFPNGIVVTSDQRAVLVAESTRYRLTKYWLTGDRAGTTETFLDDLPGIADGFTRDVDGRLLLPMYERVPALDRYVLPWGWARQVVARVPPSILLGGDPQPGTILVLSEDGQVVRHVTNVRPAPANVVPYEGEWLLGSLTGDRIRVVSRRAMGPSGA